MTECGTYLRLAIILSSPHGQAWMASHFDIYMDETFKIRIGHIDNVFRMEDFNDILDFYEIDFWSVTPESIVELLMEEIENNNYIIMYLKLIKERPEQREHLFYGFDKDKKIFYFTNLYNGKFIEMTMTFEELIDHFSFFRKIL